MDQDFLDIQQYNHVAKKDTTSWTYSSIITAQKSTRLLGHKVVKSLRKKAHDFLDKRYEATPECGGDRN